MNPTQDLSILSLVLNASILVQAVMVLLLSLSIASWTIIFRKGSILGGVRRETERFERNFWAGGDLYNLFEVAQRKMASADSAGNAAVLERIFAAGMKEFLKAKEIDAARRAMKAAYQREMDRLEANLPFLASVGSVSPYIGLLGTVWGIYHALTGIATAGQLSIEQVAGPVGESLIMTAAGLGVALPAVLAFNVMGRMINRLEHELEGFAHDVRAL